MWESSNGSYYKFENGDIPGSIIHIESFDGKHPNTYSVQILTSDGGLLAIGYIPNVYFNAEIAQKICDLALEENKDYVWWIENYRSWWEGNVVYG